MPPSDAKPGTSPNLNPLLSSFIDRLSPSQPQPSSLSKSSVSVLPAPSTSTPASLSSSSSTTFRPPFEPILPAWHPRASASHVDPEVQRWYRKNTPQVPKNFSTSSKSPAGHLALVTPLGDHLSRRGYVSDGDILRLCPIPSSFCSSAPGSKCEHLGYSTPVVDRPGACWCCSDIGWRSMPCVCFCSDYACGRELPASLGTASTHHK